MSNKIFFSIVTTAFFIFVFSGCNESDFYRHSAYEDVCRIPMIEPYVIESYDSGNSWFFNLKNKKFKGEQVNGIELIGVKNSIFVFYHPQFFIPKINTGNTPLWFIIETKSKSEMIFTSQKNYQTCLDSLGVGSVKLHEIKQLWIDFNKTGTLPPEWPCNKGK